MAEQPKNNYQYSFGEEKNNMKTEKQTVKKVLSNQDILQILKGRFPESQYALMREVRDDAGFNASRSVDYIAVGLWPSRGNHIIGFEQKKSRTDWLNELKNHAKAENIFQYCDQFYLLTTEPVGIARIEEIPANWGWITIKHNKISVIKQAPVLNPKPLSKGFIAAMLKRASDKSEYILRSEIDTIITARAKQIAEQNSKNYIRLKDDHEDLLKNIKEFEEKSGIDLKDLGSRSFQTNPQDMAVAVHAALRGDRIIDQYKNRLVTLKESAQNILEDIDKTINKL